MISKRAKDVEEALDQMDEMTLIKLVTKLEEVRQKHTDVYGVTVGGHSFYCNTHRAEKPYIIDGKTVTESEFFNLQQQARLSLVCQHGIQIIMRPPHKRRKSKPVERDGVIPIPEALLDAENSKDM